MIAFNYSPIHLQSPTLWILILMHKTSNHSIQPTATSHLNPSRYSGIQAVVISIYLDVIHTKFKPTKETSSNPHLNKTPEQDTYSGAYRISYSTTNTIMVSRDVSFTEPPLLQSSIQLLLLPDPIDTFLVNLAAQRKGRIDLHEDGTSPPVQPVISNAKEQLEYESHAPSKIPILFLYTVGVLFYTIRKTKKPKITKP
jgi:hypothetical protein